MAGTDRPDTKARGHAFAGRCTEQLPDGSGAESDARFRGFLFEFRPVCWRAILSAAAGLPLILCDADENVAAAQIVKIVGEGAHRVEDGLRIPALFKLQPFPFHSLSVQDIINLDRQMHRSPRIGQNRLQENQILHCRLYLSPPRLGVGAQLPAARTSWTWHGRGLGGACVAASLDKRRKSGFCSLHSSENLFAVKFALPLFQQCENAVEFGRLAEEHFPHIRIIGLQRCDAVFAALFRCELQHGIHESFPE